ncbi:MAG: cytochrome b/b6 domain-containing protein [Chloroflexi bacterium]|nr:cytochrome b/b6 domain-containing protein [Chloroflexota bacterium]MBP8056799.1 cytochrome b/b6 domain-containing protein [Chloroflexota bacterium]
MPQPAKVYPRFRLGARIEHFILMTSFTILGITGLAQKYAAIAVGEWMINVMGGIEQTRLIHRVAAVILVFGSVYHLLTSAYRFFVKHEWMQMIPDKKDLQDMLDTIRYNLGWSESHPKMRKFNFGEKFEYWAVIWGTLVMAITGFIMWNPIAFSSVFPGQLIPAAKAAHGGEALLAVLAIILWHMYNVHIKHFNPSMFTGNLPRHQMEEEHALELERLEAGERPWPELELPVLQKRLRVFIVATVIVSLVVVAVVIWAITFEETAITTVPRVTREIFVPAGTLVP